MMAKKLRAVPPTVSVPDLGVEEVVAVRRALANYVGLMRREELEGQQPDCDHRWSKAYVRAEIRRCEALMQGAFAVTWEWEPASRAARGRKTMEGTNGKERSLD